MYWIVNKKAGTSITTGPAFLWIRWLIKKFSPVNPHS